MPKSKYNVASAIYDIKPVNTAGSIDVKKISNIQSLLNLGRKLRIEKTGVATLRKKTLSDSQNSVSLPQLIEEESLNVKQKEPEFFVERLDIQDAELQAQSVKTDPIEDLEKYLNEDMNPVVELMSVGGSIIKQSNFKPRYRSVFFKQKTASSESNDLAVSGNLNKETNFEQEEEYQDALKEINKKTKSVLYGNFAGELPRIDVVDWWENKKNTDKPKIFPIIKPLMMIKSIEADGIKIPEPKIQRENPIFQNINDNLSKIKIQGSSRTFLKKIIVTGFVLVASVFFIEYAVSLKNEIVHDGNSAVQNLEDAGNSIKKLDFTNASADFAQAYNDFSKMGNDLNFIGDTLSSLIADLPGGGKLKSAKKLAEAGKLMADAGQAMSQAIGELSKTGLIFNLDAPGISIGNISKKLRQALIFSQKNIKEAGESLGDIDVDSLPEDKRLSFEEFNSKLPDFEKMITDAVDYSKFLEDFIGTAGLKKYLLLFQNPAELRPTGGFPGSYGIIIFKDGKLQDFRVDDIYNLDGQLKDLYVPPIQLQHITPNWAMRDANWFVDFPVSAGKITEFYKKESGEDVDGVITFSPNIVSKILEIVGPIRMDKYDLILNSQNFSQVIQEEIEYKAERSQPKKILVDLAPLMLEKIHSADSDKWMEIFNILVSSVDNKDILMYFRDLKLQNFSVVKGFSGEVYQTEEDYLMVAFTNVKGSKTDAVIDSELKTDLIIEGDDVRHKVVLTRTHKGGGTKYGFYNKQSPTYIRILVPEDAQFLGISGNSKPNFKPLLNYSKTDFLHDEDLVRFEEKINYDSETGVTTYEESGKRGYGFWMILNPGETKTIELEYRVYGKTIDNEYQFYIQKQPGLEFKDFSLKVISDVKEITQSSLELKKNNEDHMFSGRLDRDLPVKIIFR